MNKWYQTSVKFTKEFQDGTLKRVTEPYLINALSFTEAEARIYEEVGEFIRGEFSVTEIKGVDIADIFQYDDAETWFECKVVYETEDADSGKIGKVTNKFLVTAKNAGEAYDRIGESLKGLMASFTVPDIKQSKIIDIFPYEGDAETKKKNKKSKFK